MDDDNSVRRISADEHDDDHRWAFGTGFADPLAGVDTAVPDGVDAGRAGRVLPDARRRRADLLRIACSSGDPRARAGGGDRARQHRARPARPGPAAAGPGRHGRCSGTHRGRARVLPRRAGVPQRPPGRAADERLRRARRPAAGLLHLAAGPVRAAARHRATRCSPRSPPRASRSSPTTATTRPHGSSGSATAPSCRTAKMQAALDAVWPLVGRAVRHRARTRARRGRRSCGRRHRARHRLRHRHARPAGLRPLGRGRAGRTGRDGVHTEALGYILAELQSVARAHPDATW